MTPSLSLDRSRGRRLLAAAGWLAACAGGCSSARYDADYARAVAEFRTRAEFSRLQDQPVEVADGRVLVQPPKILPELLRENGADPRFPPGEDAEVKKIDPRRIRPPCLEGGPGFTVACEGVFGQANGKLPATLSMGAVPVAEMAEAEIAKSLLALVKKEEAFEGAETAWQTREVTDRAGATRQWRVLEVRGRQRIDRFAGAKEPQYDPIDASLAIWLSADKDQAFCTMLAWRVPDEIKESVKLEEVAPLVARSVTIAPPPPEPAAQFAP